MYVFGTQYLRGATPARDQWLRDMENMKEMGFNTIRAWLVWNIIEKAEGEIDYDYIDSFLSCARANDLQVGLLFHMHACPAWAVQKYARCFYVNEDGLPFEPAIRSNTPSGGWPGLCYDHEEVREMEARFIQGVVRETRKHPNVAFYEPMNEPHQWIDFRRKPNDIFCYCPASARRFQEWLRKKYGDISALNEAWGHGYSRFEEVRPPRWMASYSDWCDFRLFNMDNVAEEIRYRAELIKAVDADRPVVAHAWGGGAITCAQLGGMAFDDWKNARVMDKWGFSAFPQSASDCAALALGCDATRCAANGKEYWQAELTAGMNGTGLWQNGRIDDCTFNKFSLESIRHGAQGLMYWQYRKERFGSEFGGYALTDNAGGPTNLTRCAARLCKALQENEDVFHYGRQEKAQVALVFSIRSYLANWCASSRMDNKFAVDSASGYYRMLWEENVPVDVLHEEFFGDLNAYKVIILPSPYALSPKCAAALKEYVAAGGTILSDPYFGAFDEAFRLSYRIPGFGFEEVFGCEADELTMRQDIALHSDSRTLRLQGNIHRETYRNVRADVLWRYEDGSPAILENRFGAGRAILSGVNLGLCYSSRALISEDASSGGRSDGSAPAKEIVTRLMEQSGVRKNPCTAPGVKVSLMETGDACDSDAVILINSLPREVSGFLDIPRACSAASVVYGKAEAHPDGNRLSFRLEPDQSAVIRLLHHA